MKKLFGLCLLASAMSAAQQIPGATELPSHPFFIKKTWFIGGAGNWDYLTMDPAAQQLFIAHGAQVQVVDVATGTVAGTVGALRLAHAIALDDSGEFGYISDGPADQVRVFDRRSFQVVATIPTGPNPRALVYEPQSRLLFAICTNPLPPEPAGASPSGNQANRPANSTAATVRNQQPAPSPEIKTSITVIDAQTRQPLAQILMPGRLGFAQADGHGQVFVNIVNRNQVARLDAQSLGTMLRNRPSANAVLDWSHESRPAQSSENSLRLFALGPDCPEPSALAVDGPHSRIFVACNNMKMAVLNADTGGALTSLPIGPGTDAIGFDSSHGLIYSANGGANGSLTVIRQDVADSYAVVQVLPTRQRARTLAVNASTGDVYLVTDLLGASLAQSGGIGTLRTASVNGSFQVLVIGN
jgi:DNA-binding beta-propeller fold protein YncE